ncbi:acetate--CoA ligase family protein [Sciscionella sediminilitoris]|uniref:acetate--CoA ligase family protein n=1 Tax=Sciscionella sediminilitoris TaxID=1445613 RepID=UPI00055EB72A|nr:acetate--CoA ligase family protein [Sciscionella sp. SE31]
MTQPGQRLREDAIRELAIRYGIPANPVEFAATAREAGEIANRIAGPSAIKLIADSVVHKSKAGGVLLNVPPAEAEPAVRRLFEAQRAKAVAVRGVTVEPMIEPGPEVVVGALHEPGFGPVVMAGSGGVDVETLGDVAFALAPLDAGSATALLDRTRIGAVLRNRFPRGFEQLVQLLLRVGGPDGLLLSEPVDQIDLNPVVIGKERITAVDARAVARDRPGARELPDPATAYEQLRPAVYPECLAVLGASADPAKMGNRAVRTAIEHGFRGPVYPVSRSAKEVHGRTAFASIAELPRGIDRAVLALPAALVPDALRELAAIGTRTAHVYTADTGDLAEAVAGTGLRVLGPNCIGHYSPHARMTMIGSSASSTEPGSIAFVSQSGTYAGDVVRRGKELGLRFSFVSSVGNCDDVSPAELLAFCAADPRTTLAAFYLEDDSDAGRFFALAERIEIPVVLFKGGRSTAGGAAAASHTGALASDPQLLRDAAAAAGVVLVENLDELLDTLLVAQHAPALTGIGLGLVGSGGGVAVVGTDTAGEHGLTVAPLSAATTDALARYDAPGSSLSNPVDIPIWSLYDETGPFTGALARALAADPAIDCLCAYLDLGTVYDIHSGAEAAALIRELTEQLCAADRAGVPLVLVLRSSFSAEQEELVRELRATAAGYGVPLLDSVERAIAALGRVGAANRFRAGSGER